MKGHLSWLRTAWSWLEIEDVLLFFITLVLLLWLGHDALRSRLRELPPGLFALGLAFLGYGDFFVCAATHVQPVDAEGAPHTGRGRLLLLAAYLGQISGYPMLAYLLADRDNGEVFSLILIAVLTVIAYALSFRRGARTLSSRSATPPWLPQCRRCVKCARPRVPLTVLPVAAVDGQLAKVLGVSVSPRELAVMGWLHRPPASAFSVGLPLLKGACRLSQTAQFDAHRSPQTRPSRAPQPCHPSAMSPPSTPA